MLDLDQLAPEKLRPLRRSEYDQLVRQGVFDDERLELLRGMLVEMSPQKAIHAEVISRLSERLVRALNGRARVRAQAPLALSDDSEPEPDVAVVPSGDYFGDHPSTALLVVEVADSSLRKDRRIKGSLYAEALIAEYWIVNLQDREIELLTQPESGSYTKEDRKRIDDVIRLVGFPDIEIPVDTILPRR